MALDSLRVTDVYLSITSTSDLSFVYISNQTVLRLLSVAIRQLEREAFSPPPPRAGVKNA
jgi:hypothetical protein